jgi:hypothetical protein
VRAALTGLFSFLAIPLLVTAEALAVGESPVVTYRFNDSFAADEPGVFPLATTDPFRMNRFETATVYGQPRRVYHYDGTPQVQAGLTLIDTRGIGSAGYTVEMVMRFVEGDGTYRRLLETHSRRSDEGFYVDPSNNLTIYPLDSGTTPFVTGRFHYVALSFDGLNAQVFLDGQPQFKVEAPMMDLTNPDNPYRIMNFFLDNEEGFNTEYADGNVALIRLTSGVLSESEIAARAVDPFAIPEPAAWVLALAGVGSLLALRRLAGTAAA